jgi:hypothetical protein
VCQGAAARRCSCSKMQLLEDAAAGRYIVVRMQLRLEDASLSRYSGPGPKMSPRHCIRRCLCACHCNPGDVSSPLYSGSLAGSAARGGDSDPQSPAHIRVLVIGRPQTPARLRISGPGGLGLAECVLGRVLGSAGRRRAGWCAWEEERGVVSPLPPGSSGATETAAAPWHGRAVSILLAA